MLSKRKSIDDYEAQIAFWHDHYKGELELHAYLGLSWEEYKSLLEVKTTEQGIVRTFTRLEKVLVSFGFAEIYGIGLWGRELDSLAADTNSGMVKLVPHIDASYDDFIDIFDEDRVEELIAKLESLDKEGV